MNISCSVDSFYPIRDSRLPLLPGTALSCLLITVSATYLDVLAVEDVGEVHIAAAGYLRCTEHSEVGAPASASEASRCSGVLMSQTAEQTGSIRMTKMHKGMNQPHLAAQHGLNTEGTRTSAAQHQLRAHGIPCGPAAKRIHGKRSRDMQSLIL